MAHSGQQSGCLRISHPATNAAAGASSASSTAVLMAMLNPHGSLSAIGG